MIDCTEKMTKELKELLQQYENLFGYDPRGEMSFELDYLENEEDDGYYDLVAVLKKCVNNKKDIFYYWGIDDDDDDW